MTTNELGLREPSVGPRTSKRRVLAVGDSTTFGWGVDDDKTWPAQLEEILNRDANGVSYEVLNAGVNGYSSFQGLQYLRRKGLRLKPDIVIVCFGFNDAMTWGDRGDREYARLLAMERLDDLLLHSRLYGVFKNWAINRQASPAIGQSPRRPRLTPLEFEQVLKEIGTLSSRAGAQVLYLIWPLPGHVSTGRQEGPYERAIRNAGKATGATVVDLLDSFRAADQPLYADPVHANAAGCRIAAEEIARRLLEMDDKGP